MCVRTHTHTHSHTSSECRTCAGCLVLIPSRSEVFTTRYCLFCAKHPISLQTSLASVPTQPLRLFLAHWCPGPPASPNVSTLALLPSPFQEGLQFRTHSLPESLISKMHHREAFSMVGRPPAGEADQGLKPYEDEHVSRSPEASVPASGKWRW